MANEESQIDLHRWFKCIECEDTGLIWEPDPEFPHERRMDLLVPCSCQIVEMKDGR